MSTSQALPELAPGAELPQRELGPLTEGDFVRFAGASGDFNPLHYDESFVTDAGYPGLFAMGLFPCGALAHYLAGHVGQTSVREFGVRFTALVYEGDTLTLSARVASVDEDEASLELAATRQTGEMAIRGFARVALASEPGR
jgi:acyl dehydratase